LICSLAGHVVGEGVAHIHRREGIGNVDPRLLSYLPFLAAQERILPLGHSQVGERLGRRGFGRHALVLHAHSPDPRISRSLDNTSAPHRFHLAFPLWRRSRGRGKGAARCQTLYERNLATRPRGARHVLKWHLVCRGPRLHKNLTEVALGSLSPAHLAMARPRNTQRRGLRIHRGSRRTVLMAARAMKPARGSADHPADTGMQCPGPAAHRLARSVSNVALPTPGDAEECVFSACVAF